MRRVTNAHIYKKIEGTDEEVERMLEKWDIVKCKYCGKEISMIDSKLIRNSSQEYFVCKEHILDR